MMYETTTVAIRTLKYFHKNVGTFFPNLIWRQLGNYFHRCAHQNELIPTLILNLVNTEKRKISLSRNNQVY